jgi:hypothetical protein
MADPELVRTLDFILNRCDEQAIDAVAAAVVRRRKELAMFGGTSMPNPANLAKNLSSQLNMEGAIEGMQKSVRDYAVRIIRQEAPELSDEQIEQLTRAWIPEKGKSTGSGAAGKSGLPRDLLASMIDQFISFSEGRMEAEEDEALRREMGPWPDKYWKSFPQVVRLLIADYLKGEMKEADFNTRIELALK